MKNRNLTYLLIAVVLVIWGLIFYKIFSGLNDGYVPDFTKINKKQEKQVFEEEEEILILSTNYRDPFLDATSKANAFRDNTSKGILIGNPGTQRKKKEKVTDWSFIDYIGIINNKETNKKIALVIISGRDYMVNEKDVINGVTILKRGRDSLLVEFEGEKVWVRR